MADNGKDVTQRQGEQHKTGDEHTAVIALAQMQDQAEIEALRRELEEMRLQAEHCRQDARRAEQDRLEAEASYRRTIEEAEDQYQRESDASRQRVREMESLIQSERDRLGTRFEHQEQVIGSLKRRVRIAEQETASMKSWAEAGGRPQLSSRPDDIRQSDAGDVAQVPSGLGTPQLGAKYQWTIAYRQDTMLEGLSLLLYPSLTGLYRARFRDIT